MDTNTRFVKKIRHSPNNDCWEWIGSIDKNGHARLLIDGKNCLAHKYSYEFYNKKVSSGPVQHTCKMLHCVNPKHLTENNNGGRPSKVSKQEIVTAHQNGLSIAEIANKFNCSTSLVRKRLK